MIRLKEAKGKMGDSSDYEFLKTQMSALYNL